MNRLTYALSIMACMALGLSGCIAGEVARDLSTPAPPRITGFQVFEFCDIDEDCGPLGFCADDWICGDDTVDDCDTVEADDVFVDEYEQDEYDDDRRHHNHRHHRHHRGHFHIERTTIEPWAFTH